MSQVYESREQFEHLFSRLFEQIAADDGLASLVDQQMVIRFRVEKPTVEWWIDGRSDPVQGSFTDLQIRATLTAELTGDSLHELLLGTLPLGKALFWGKLKVSGSKSKAMRLEPLLHACQAAYPALAEAELGGS